MARPQSSQTLINVTNGKLFRLLVDDEPFDVRYGNLLASSIACSISRRAIDKDRGMVALPTRTDSCVSRQTRIVSFTSGR